LFHLFIYFYFLLCVCWCMNAWYRDQSGRLIKIEFEVF